MKKLHLKTLQTLLGVIEQANDDITDIGDELENKLENMSDKRRESDKGIELENELENVRELIDAIETVRDVLGNFELQ